MLRQLSEQGAVIMSDDLAAAKPVRTRRTAAKSPDEAVGARPAKRAAGPQETRPAGRTVADGTAVEPLMEEPDVSAVQTAPAWPSP